MIEFEKYAREMLDFIEKSPGCFHAVANVAEMLEAQGFQRLEEADCWDLERGSCFYTVRNDSSLIAFRLPGRDKGCRPRGFHIAAAHSDSPSFKIKENPEIAVEDQYLKLNTEKYGGMILSTWMDRALSAAGRVAVRTGQGVESRLVDLDSDLFVIPNLAIHMNRDINKGVEYNPQTDMLPLYCGCGGETKGVLAGRIARKLGVDKKDILGQDLFLYVREKGRILGENGDFILSPRLDDLQCVYASVRGFLDSEPEEYINVCVVFDSEEVGSGTRQGADSGFLENVLQRIAEGLYGGREEYLSMLAGSFLISADNAHGVHPNHPEKADPTNRPYLNGGIVLKYHGGQKYTTDAVSGAKIRVLCERAGIPCQTYANRSDVPGGSTLGCISVSHVSVESADIGLAQLAMHSAVETAGMKDTGYGVALFREFYKS